MPKVCYICAMNNNAIAFTALCNEYCTVLANPAALKPADFIATMLRLLPRIYICARDLSADNALVETGWIDAALTEEEYEESRRMVGALLGEHDVYLEVFEEDMKYSDTPVSTSVSENLADIYQVLFDFLNTVRLGTDAVVDEAIMSVKESFKEFWSATLCNVLRALNNIWAQGLITDDDDSETHETEGMD